MKPTVIYKCCGLTGLGSSLMNAVNIAYYAWRQECRFAMDMRAFQYLEGDAHGGFFANFELTGPPGFAVLTDLAALDRLYRAPNRTVLLWQEDCPGLLRRPPGDVVIFPDVPYAGRYTKDRPVAVRGPDPWRTRLKRRLRGRPARFPDGYFSLALRGRLRDEVEPLLDERFAGGPVIGVQFRHGNGEFLHARFSDRTFDGYEAAYRAILARYVEAVQGLQRRDERLRRVFLASDNARFIEEMRAAIAGAFALEVNRPDRPFQEHLRASGRDFSILRGAAADLFGLARCERVVSGPTGMVELAALIEGPLRDAGRVVVAPPAPEIGPQGAEIRAVLAELYLSENEVMTAHAAICEVAGDLEGAAWAGRLRRWTAHVHDRAWQQSIAALRRGDLAAALEASAAARGGDPDNPFLEAYEAALLGLAGRLAEAERMSRAAVAREPSVPRLHQRLAWVLERQGRLEEAIAAARAAAATRPAAPKHLLEVARLLERAGRPEEAEATYRRAIAIDAAVQEWLPPGKRALVPERLRWRNPDAAGAALQA